ncbi:hypothetical protein BD311DRAFT_767586, partial [Dichomitus squalens]
PVLLVGQRGDGGFLARFVPLLLIVYGQGECPVLSPQRPPSDKRYTRVPRLPAETCTKPSKHHSNPLCEVIMSSDRLQRVPTTTLGPWGNLTKMLYRTSKACSPALCHSGQHAAPLPPDSVRLPGAIDAARNPYSGAGARHAEAKSVVATTSYYVTNNGIEGVAGARGNLYTPSSYVVPGANTRRNSRPAHYVETGGNRYSSIDDWPEERSF